MLESQHGVVRDETGNGPTRLPVSLAGEINAATRTLHTTLNRLITSRLPLALPPHSSDPTLYATGLLHFAHIFLTFESLWADLPRHDASASPSPPSSPPFSPLLSYLLVNPYDSPSLFTSTLGAPTPPSPQLASFLHTLRPRGLIRSSRLKRDLEYLFALHPTDLQVLLAKYPGDKVAAFCTHIRKSINEKPWTLVSYAWCFYMAIFSGGRWIRGALLHTPPGFWPQTEHRNPVLDLENRGLSFWHFPGMLDGEDIKAEFKARLADAEALFTPDERVDIIEEAKNIFRLCASLVDELDQQIGTDSTTSPPAHEQERQSDIKEAAVEIVSVPNTKSAKSAVAFTTFLRRPEVTGTLVAVGCLACVALLRLQ